MPSKTSVIDIKAFLGISEVNRILPKARVSLTDHSYSPKLMDPRSDWVASVAAPSFLALAQVGVTAPTFCSVGTGAGLDGLAAIEILKANRLVITDIHNDVVEQARINILSNIDIKGVTVAGYVGDVLSCLDDQTASFDLIYENLPNIPLVNEDIGEGQNSSTFIAARNEELPGFVTSGLLALHYIALRQATSLLRPGGRLLSSIGGRVPLSTILRLAGETRYDCNILVYTWKVQSEPHEVVGGYAGWERQGLGPFHFYPPEVLSEAFYNLAPAVAGAQALEIERALAPHRISATDALKAMEAGKPVGHTVAVLDSRKR